MLPNYETMTKNEVYAVMLARAEKAEAEAMSKKLVHHSFLDLCAKQRDEAMADRDRLRAALTEIRQAEKDNAESGTGGWSQWTIDLCDRATSPSTAATKPAGAGTLSEDAERIRDLFERPEAKWHERNDEACRRDAPSPAPGTEPRITFAPGFAIGGTGGGSHCAAGSDVEIISRTPILVGGGTGAPHAEAVTVSIPRAVATNILRILERSKAYDAQLAYEHIRAALYAVAVPAPLPPKETT